MNKKAIELATNTIVILALLLIVLITMIWVFQTYLKKETSIIGEQIDSLGDCDCDKVRNFLDKCPCEPAEEGAELAGCPVAAKQPISCNKEQCEAAQKQYCAKK